MPFNYDAQLILVDFFWKLQNDYLLNIDFVFYLYYNWNLCNSTIEITYKHVAWKNCNACYRNACYRLFCNLLKKLHLDCCYYSGIINLIIVLDDNRNKFVVDWLVLGQSWNEVWYFWVFPFSVTRVTDFRRALSAKPVDLSLLCEHGDLA